MHVYLYEEMLTMYPNILHVIKISHFSPSISFIISLNYGDGKTYFANYYTPSILANRILEF